MRYTGLDDLYVRFIINRPQEDLSEVERLCFAIEESHWYYEDFIRPLEPSLPTFALKDFVEKVFEHCPLLSDYSKAHSKMAFEQFIQYKKRIPVRGAILLNPSMDKVVLVKGWKKSANWGFPRGKVNKDEAPLDCAIRELLEETGFDLRRAGLVPQNGRVKHIEIEIKEQQIRLYVFRNVLEDTVFQPQTRCEISDVKWWKISDLPAFRKRPQKGEPVGPAVDAASRAGKFYMVAPFLDKLKKWIIQQKKQDTEKARITQQQLAQPDYTEDEAFVTDTYHTDAAPLGQEAPSPNAEDIADANAELKRLLKISESNQNVFTSQPPPPPQQQQESKSRNDESSLISILKKGSVSNILVDVSASTAASTFSGVSKDMGMLATGTAEDTHGIETAKEAPHIPINRIHSEASQPLGHQQHFRQGIPQSLSTYASTYSCPSNHDPSFASHHQGQMAGELTLTSHGRDNSSLQQTVLRRQHLRNESIPLVHPQPKPPQVQYNLLTHGMSVTPEVRPAPTVQQTQNISHHKPQAQSEQQFLQATSNNRWQPQPSQHQPQQQQHVPSQSQDDFKKTAPALTSHSLTLLNAFKKSESKPGQPTHFSEIPSSQHDLNLKSSQEAGLAAYGSEEAGQLIQEPKSRLSQSEMNAMLPVDSHKSSLLNLFKQTESIPNPHTFLQSRTEAVGMNSGANQSTPPIASNLQLYRVTENQDNGVSLIGCNPPSLEVAKPAYKNDFAAKEMDNGNQLQTHQEKKSASRVANILSHPNPVSRVDSSPAASSHVLSYPSPKSQSRTIGSPRSHLFHSVSAIGSSQMTSPRARALPIQKRPESLSKQSFASSYSSSHAQPPTGSPYGAYGGYTSPYAASSQADSESHHSRGKETTDEHKRGLLALFSGDNAANMSPGFDKGKSLGLVSCSGTPRSHVLSMASGNVGMSTTAFHQQAQFQHHHSQPDGPPSVASASMSRQGSQQTNASRRGSQTPISPADRDFLLGYLSTKIDRTGSSG